MLDYLPRFYSVDLWVCRTSESSVLKVRSASTAQSLQSLKYWHPPLFVGVAAGFLPTLLSYLPNLIALDTDYLPSTMRTPPSQPLPSLKRLTVRLNAVRTIEWADWRFLVYLISPTDKAPSSLTEIVIDGNALHGISIGSVHSRWVFEVAERQKRLGKISLERFSVQSVEIATQELQHVFEAFPGIKELRCTLASKELVSGWSPFLPYIFSSQRVPLLRKRSRRSLLEPATSSFSRSSFTTRWRSPLNQSSQSLPLKTHER